MRVNQFDRVVSRKRRSAGQQFVIARPKRVEVRSRIHGKTCASGLLWRDVGERSLQLVRSSAFHGKRPQRSRDPEIDQRDRAAGRVPDQIARIDVAVDDAGFVKPTDRLRDLDGDLQKFAEEKRAMARAFG